MVIFFISLPPRFARFYAFSRLIAFFSRLALIFDKLCGTCRSFLMAGTLRVRTAEKTTLKPWGSLSVRRPKLPASAFGLAPGRFTCSATSHRLSSLQA